MILKEFNEKMEEIPGSVPNIVKGINEKWGVLNNNDKNMEGFGEATPIIMFILSLILSIAFFFYANYILVKCYCNHFGHYLFASSLMYAVPGLMVPFLYYQRFSGNGSCKTFPCEIQKVR